MKLNLKFTKRLFWKVVLLFPKFIRAKIVRSRFEVVYDLNPDIVFKQATTKDEIEQALNLVYDSYINLNYIDTNPDRLHLTKYLTLPTTTILVIKIKDQVIGTMSIVMDSSLGLPTETTWNINNYKKNGMNIAEISALAIRKDMKSNKGHLLLPLCKLMYLFSANILKLDGLVIATTYEVEPFYTDLMLFDKIPDSHGQKHDMVKGNKSSCCFIELGDFAKNKYYKTYAHKNKKFNLHNYFVVCETANIILPSKMLSVQAQLKEKNIAMTDLLIEKPHLFSGLSEKEKLIIGNLDPTQYLNNTYSGSINDRKSPRLVTQLNGLIVKKDSLVSIPIMILDISQSGLKFRLLNAENALKIDEEITIKIDKHLSTSKFDVKVMWLEKNNFFGCSILTKSQNDWNKFQQKLWIEIHEIDEKEKKKAA